jgi:hypothetical protein
MPCQIVFFNNSSEDLAVSIFRVVKEEHHMYPHLE